MFNFVSNWKNYLLVILLTCNGLLYYQKNSIDNKLQACKNDAAYMQAANKLANELKAKQEQEIRLTEQDAAKAQAESQKRTDSLMNKSIQGGCEGANQFLLDYALGFHWKNNIP